MPDVWWARPVDPRSARGLVALLDHHEQERLAAFRRPADAARYLAAHALTRIVLGRHLDLDPAVVKLDRTCRCGRPHGKPMLTETPDDPGFSLTHSGAWVGVALSAEGPIGLDVEQVRELTDLDAMVAHALSPAERRRPPRDTASFLRLWSRKEALLKATGEGLATPMTTITLSAPDAPAELLSWDYGLAWVTDLDVGEGYVAAVAGFGDPMPEIRVHGGDALLRS